VTSCTATDQGLDTFLKRIHGGELVDRIEVEQAPLPELSCTELAKKTKKENNEKAGYHNSCIRNRTFTKHVDY